MPIIYLTSPINPNLTAKIIAMNSEKTEIDHARSHLGKHGTFSDNMYSACQFENSKNSKIKII